MFLSRVQAMDPLFAIRIRGRRMSVRRRLSLELDALVQPGCCGEPSPVLQEQQYLQSKLNTSKEHTIMTGNS